MSSRIKYGLLAGALGLGVSVGVFVYLNRRQKRLRDETDEGIGDVDSIISDSEIEDGNLSRLDSPVRKNSKHNLDNMEPVVLESVVVDVRSALNRPSSTSTAPAPFQPTQTVIEDGNVNISQLEQNRLKVLVLGLDKSGKTALIEMLTKHQDRQPDKYTPTKGFNVAQTISDGVAFDIMEVGGSENMRQYWPQFVQNTSLLVYVVDGSNPDCFDDSKSELTKILQLTELSKVPCLLLANKQDIKGAVSSDKIFTESDLKKFSAKRTLKLTLLDTVCIPSQLSSVLDYADTIMAVILNILDPKSKK